MRWRTRRRYGKGMPLPSPRSPRSKSLYYNTRRQYYKIDGKRNKTSPMEATARHKIPGRRDSTAKMTLIPQDVTEGPAQRFPPTKTLTSKGLENSGNMCYRNALLQCLLHVPQFYRHLGKVHRDCWKETSKCAICALQYLAHRYYNDPPMIRNMDVRGPVQAVRAFHKACNSCPPIDQKYLRESFEEGAQDDAWDFFFYLYKQFHRVKSIRDLAPQEKLFDIGRKVTWRCHECGHAGEYHPVDTAGLGPSLNIFITSRSKGSTLEEYLQMSLQGEERYKCEHGTCKLKTYEKDEDGSVRTSNHTITALPQVLIIRLLRYSYIEEMGGLRGVREECFVPFGEYLNLGRYTAAKNDEMYRLDGVVSHRGQSVHSGHYIATVRTANGFDFETINDNHSISQRSGGSFREMLVPKSEDEGSGFLPYVLIYSKM